MRRIPITIEVSETVYALLQVLGPTGQPADIAVQAAVEALVDHAQQGVYRPGSWERGWLHQAFGDSWEQLLEPGDPHGRPDDATSRRFFQRPRRFRCERCGRTFLPGAPMCNSRACLPGVDGGRS